MALEPVGVGAQVELAGLGEAALLAVVRGQPRPEHVAIIMDGNGRWATRRGLPRVAGHREGVKAARTIVRAADALGLRYLTLYAFSSENWSRPEGEVSTLLSLLERAIRSELPELMRRNVRLRVLGRPHGVPVQVRRGIDHVVQATRDNAGLTLMMAFNYGDRKSTRLNSSHVAISYAVFCLKKKTSMLFRRTVNTLCSRARQRRCTGAAEMPTSGTYQPMRPHPQTNSFA